MQTLEIVNQPKATRWLFSSPAAGYIWLVVRLWLGYEWLHAGWSKLFGAESQAFWTTGLGLKGFATGAIASHSGAHAPVVYGWWVAFLRDFVLPNYSWIAKVVALGEALIGIALILGFMTGLTALLGLILNLTYLYSGTVSTNPTFVVLGVLLIAAWRIAGLYGADYFVLPELRRLLHGHKDTTSAGPTETAVTTTTPVKSADSVERQTVSSS